MKRKTMLTMLTLLPMSLLIDEDVLAKPEQKVEETKPRELTRTELLAAPTGTAAAERDNRKH